MEDFALKFLEATFYVIIGGAVLVWGLNKLCEAMEKFLNTTAEDWFGFGMVIVLITVVALII